MAGCVDCGRQTPRRRCKQCALDRRYSGLEPTIAVVCACGFRDAWQPVDEFTLDFVERDGTAQHEHDAECEATTRYQAIGDDGDPDPTRAGGPGGASA